MKPGFIILVLCILFMLLVQCLACGDHCEATGENSRVLSRQKRYYLDFLKASRVFFRANIKQTLFTWGAIWAFAQGWKANFNMLNNNKGIRPIYFRRDTYEVLQDLLDFHGLDGKACVLKAFCTATRTPDGEMAGGMLFKLVRHIFTRLDKMNWTMFLVFGLCTICLIIAGIF